MNHALRQTLRSGRCASGLFVTLESPAISEIAAAVGLDWVCIDMEHGALDYADVVAHLRALNGSPTAGLVRVPTIDLSAIRRCLDLGAHGLILPWVRSAADLDFGMRAARYPPRGVRGIGGDRAFGYRDFADYVARADDEILVIPLIETREAVQDIDAILSAPGLEAIFFGPADLSASYGYAGAWEGPGVAETILDVRARAAARGIGAGILARNDAEVRQRRDQGFAMVSLGADAGRLTAALHAGMSALRGEGQE